jgi:hypothetical protein
MPTKRAGAASRPYSAQRCVNCVATTRS